VAALYTERSLLEFQKLFATEEACAKHLAEQRWALGFACPRCGHDQFWFLAKRGLFDCKQCRYQASVTAGTIFHKTRTSLVKWYWLLYRMAMDKIGTSVSEIQRLLEIGSYKTAWLMAHKIRKAMADRDARYQLAGLVELDESFFGPPGKRRGRGSENKTTVLCAVSLYRDAKGQERPGFARMAVVTDVSTKTVEDFLEKLGCGADTEEGCQLLEAIRTDGWRSYPKAAKNKEIEHCRVVLRQPRDVAALLPWVHRVISNAKAVIRGTHRGVSDKHLESYLAEIGYRFNRRFWEKQLFDRLVQACVTTETITYSELTSRPERAKRAFRS
jgi:transposase-like protein